MQIQAGPTLTRTRRRQAYRVCAPLQLRALAASVADTVGYIIGAYGYGEPRGDVGKFTLTLRRRANGPWLILSDMDNPSLPPQ